MSTCPDNILFIRLISFILSNHHHDCHPNIIFLHLLAYYIRYVSAHEQLAPLLSSSSIVAIAIALIILFQTCVALRWLAVEEFTDSRVQCDVFLFLFHSKGVWNSQNVSFSILVTIQINTVNSGKNTDITQISRRNFYFCVSRSFCCNEWEGTIASRFYLFKLRLFLSSNPF